MKPKPKTIPKKVNGATKGKTKILSELEPAPPKGLYSDSLSNYIVQAYQKCKEREKEEAIMTQLLKEEIANAQRMGQINRDWSTHPLPSLPVERQKASTLTFEKVHFILRHRVFLDQVNSSQKLSIMFQMHRMENLLELNYHRAKWAKVDLEQTKLSKKQRLSKVR